MNEEMRLGSVESEKVVSEVPDEFKPGMTNEQMWDVIKKRVLAAADLKELNDFLETMTASSRYVAIRDFVGRTKGDMIKSCRYSDVDEYQKYQSMKQDAEDTYKHDNTTAKLGDVDRACTQLYGILVKMIKVLQDEINVLQKAVNAVERETEIEPTEWNPQEKQEITKEEISDDHNTEEDVQGEPESI